MKKIIILLICILMLVSCTSQQNENEKDFKTTDLTQKEIWSIIENNEWSTFECGWNCGYGIYFYTENDTKYALSKTYGSGLPVVNTYKSEVKLKDNMIYLDFPVHLIEGTNISDEVIEIVLVYKDNILYFGDIKLHIFGS